ncbi:unnamed protein product [Citrullus colocynthis]|uniref:Hydroxyproline-rich glycoprotein family protein n=1 Tax=Citrullus colocynthis TaxID=252529 RepID=A0ABP0Z0B2_9ROSI
MSRSIGRKVPGFSLLSNANKLSFVPFSSSSSFGGHGRGRGRGGFPSHAGPFDFTSPVPGQEDSNTSKQDSVGSRPTPGLGHGKPTPSSPILPSFSSFSPSVNPSSAGRGRVPPPIRSPPGPGSSKGSDSEPKKPVFFSKDNAGDSASTTRPGALHRGVGERNLPDTLLSGFPGVGRGKPMKQPGQEAQPKQENRHLRPSGVGEPGRGRGGGQRMSRDGPGRNTGGMMSRIGPGGEDGGDRGRSGLRGRGTFRGRGGFRGRGRGGIRTGERWERGRVQDMEDGYAAGLYLGDNADGEKLAKRIGTEHMNQLVEGFEEMSVRVLPSPLEEEYLDAVHTNYMIECEPEYLMGDFESNPDIDENPPIPLRDALEKMKPFLMAYENIQSHEEWEEIMEETMQRVPLLKEIVDYYSGPDRVTAKQQQGELERVAKTLPQSAPNSIKQFTNRAVLSLQSNPGWGFDKKCQFMDKLVREFSQRYK